MWTYHRNPEFKMGITTETSAKMSPSAEEANRSEKVSGETEDTRDNTTKLYCRRNRKRGTHGAERDGSALRSMRVVGIVRLSPKFGALD